jgi:hypothetical protein
MIAPPGNSKLPFVNELENAVTVVPRRIDPMRNVCLSIVVLS